MNSNQLNKDLNYNWQPLTFDYLFSRYRVTDKKVIFALLVWLILVGAGIFASLGVFDNAWIPNIGLGADIFHLYIFNPALLLGILLLFWFGFEWGFVPAYLSVFAIAYVSEISILWSSLIGIAFALGLGLIALAYHSIQIDYNLRSLKSITFFVVIAFISALASSMGSFIWSFFHQLSANETLLIWKSWWTGIFFQTILILGPVIFLLSPRIERFKRDYFTLPPQKPISIKWIYGSVISIVLTLCLFIFSGYLLGKMNVQEAIRANNMITESELMGAIGAFEIIAWTSLGLILISGYTAIYLLNNWNSTLQCQVASRTRELEESRESLKNSLTQKDILFKEIQHRVKNNLAQVHGLLELQETMNENPELSDILKISKSRIRTMSLAHEALYNNPDFSKISLKEYLENISKVTHASFKDSSKTIDLEFDVEDLHLDMGKAIPLGLMVSEILINSHKHAFNGRPDGAINIESKINNRDLILKIGDNGTGISEDIDMRQSNSLGMILVNNFTQQLRGEMDLDSNNNGTWYTFQIPLTSIVIE